MKRHPGNPILTRADIPAAEPRLADVSSVFNPGAVRRADGRVTLVLRVQTRGRETVLMVAESDDGETFTVPPRLVEIEGIEAVGETVYHAYDPRLTAVGTEQRVFMVFAADTDTGCRVGIAAECGGPWSYEMVAYDERKDARNGVLFPETIRGRFLRLERPNRLGHGVIGGDRIMLAESVDLIEWKTVGLVMRGRPRLWDELIGSGPPPIKTREGWLHIYHGVATHLNLHLYQAGVCLLDLDDPSRVIARSRNNILEPREPYELAGQVPNVVFPTGAIVDDVDRRGFAGPDSVVRVYYGAADTVVGLATTTVRELMGAME